MNDVSGLFGAPLEELVRFFGRLLENSDGTSTEPSDDLLSIFCLETLKNLNVVEIEMISKKRIEKKVGWTTKKAFKMSHTFAHD